MQAIATIYDVALHAGLSPKTVSRVINGSTQIRPATRDRVLKAMEELQYTPSMYARGMAGRCTHVLGIYACDRQRFFSDTMRFFTFVLDGFEAGLAGTGYRLLLDSPSLHTSENALVSLARQVDGILVINCPNERERAALAYLRERVPVVTIGRREIEGEEAYAVGPDNAGNVEMAVRHLARLGHRSVGLFLGADEGEHHLDRLAGYERALAQLGLPRQPQWVIRGTPQVAQADRLRSWLSSPGRPTAVFIDSEWNALAFVEAVGQLGLTIPDDIAVVTYEDSYAAGFASPPLTVVRRDDRLIGREAAMLLLRLIRGEAVEPRVRLIPGEIVVRKSCGGQTSGIRGNGK